MRSQSSRAAGMGRKKKSASARAGPGAAAAASNGYASDSLRGSDDEVMSRSTAYLNSDGEPVEPQHAYAGAAGTPEDDAWHEVVLLLADKNARNRMAALRELLVPMHSKLQAAALSAHAEECWQLVQVHSVKRGDAEELGLAAVLMVCLALHYSDSGEVEDLQQASALLLRYGAGHNSPRAVYAACALLFLDRAGGVQETEFVVAMMRKLEAVMHAGVPELAAELADVPEPEIELLLAATLCFGALAARLPTEILQRSLFREPQDTPVEVELSDGDDESVHDLHMNRTLNGDGGDDVAGADDDEKLAPKHQRKALAKSSRAKQRAKERRQSRAEKSDLKQISASNYESRAVFALLHIARGDPLRVVNDDRDSANQLRVTALSVLGMAAHDTDYSSDSDEEDERDFAEQEHDEFEEEDEHEHDPDYAWRPTRRSVCASLDELLEDIDDLVGGARRTGKKQRSTLKSLAGVVAEIDEFGQRGSEQEIELPASHQTLVLSSHAERYTFAVFSRVLGLHSLRLYLELNIPLRDLFDLGKPAVNSAELIALASQNASAQKRSAGKRSKHKSRR
ncbi:hypothetical protein FVE85_6366 [Porphyridium purpureum]|uniref:Interferon-related developmental regulator N-terminal domain-containing protein n=1 Tax=Porphyridium purpureum TaxID=35688 RepID=A0A5J4Z4J3_PORPP|nr:hypothetical protein FVE85_6366 [Porphyridium purpureum]|eukprot:POR8937..scf295_1